MARVLFDGLVEYPDGTPPATPPTYFKTSS